MLRLARRMFLAPCIKQFGSCLRQSHQHYTWLVLLNQLISYPVTFTFECIDSSYCLVCRVARRSIFVSRCHSKCLILISVVVVVSRPVFLLSLLLTALQLRNISSFTSSVVSFPVQLSQPCKLSLLVFLFFFSFRLLYIFSNQVLADSAPLWLPLAVDVIRCVLLMAY